MEGYDEEFEKTASDENIQTGNWTFEYPYDYPKTTKETKDGLGFYLDTTWKLRYPKNVVYFMKWHPEDETFEITDIQKLDEARK